MNTAQNTTRMEKIPAERILARLGYSLGRTPAGLSVWQGEARLRGEPVKVLLMGVPGQGGQEGPASLAGVDAPTSLTEPVWAVYYEPGEGGEMLHDERFQTLAEYVTEQLLDSKGGKLLLYAKPQADCRADDADAGLTGYARARCA